MAEGCGRLLQRSIPGETSENHEKVSEDSAWA